MTSKGVFFSSLTGGGAAVLGYHVYLPADLRYRITASNLLLGVLPALRLSSEAGGQLEKD